MPLLDLVRAVLAASTDQARTLAGARLAELPDALGEIAKLLTSPDWAERELALHFVTRLSPPPALFAPGVLHCLRAPLRYDPLGDELALVLVCCGALARELAGAREEVASRAAAIDHAEGPRAPVMSRLAHETLAKLDVARAELAAHAAELRAARIAKLRAGHQDEVRAEIWAEAASEYYAELARATRWEELADVLADRDRAAMRYCLERALEDFRWHAGTSTSGGEGMARMLDVRRLEQRLAAC